MDGGTHAIVKLTGPGSCGGFILARVAHIASICLQVVSCNDGFAAKCRRIFCGTGQSLACRAVLTVTTVGGSSASSVVRGGVQVATGFMSSFTAVQVLGFGGTG